MVERFGPRLDKADFESLETSWSALGALLGALGALLGLSGAPLGPLLGHLGGHRSKKRAALICAAPRGPNKSPLGALLNFLKII